LVGVRKNLDLASRKDAFEDRPLRVLYGYVVMASVEIPRRAPLLLTSVHTPARPVADLLPMLKHARGFDPSEIQYLGLGEIEPWCSDLAFDSVDRQVRGQRFIVGGDWNNARLFDTTVPRFKGTSAQFFRRCAEREWFECHQAKGEVRTFLPEGSHPYQLDHVFCDVATSKEMLDCAVWNDSI
jgi:hypothetical protein